MKANATPELRASWWRNHLPKSLTRSGALLTQLTTFEARWKELTDESTGACFERVLVARKGVRQASEALMKEVKEGLQRLGAGPEKTDYENTRQALQKFLDTTLEQAGREAEALVEPAGNAFADLDEYKAQLKKVMGRLQNGPMHFAFGAGETATAHRFLFHGSRSGQTLAQALRQEHGLRKVGWGMAVALEGRPGTLGLHVEGSGLPGMAGKGKALLRALGGLPFSNVVLVVDGQEVDDIPEPAADGETADGGAAGGAADGGAAVPTAGEPNLDPAPADPNDPQVLAGSWKKVKAALFPVIRETLAGTDSHKGDIQSLVREALQAEQEGRLADAIAILRDRLPPHLAAARRAVAGNEGLHVDRLKPGAAPPAGGATGANPSLQAALAGGGGGPADPRAFFEKVQVANADESAREWAVNYAALQHFAAGLPDGPAKQALQVRSVTYLTKFANIPNAQDLHWQSNPVQLAMPGGNYHRGGGTNLYKALRDQVSETLGLTPENVFLASDPRILEAVQRDFTTRGAATDFGDWDDDQLDSIINTAAMNRPVFIDVTRHARRKGEAGNQDQACQEALTEVVGRLEPACYRLAGQRFGIDGLTAEALANIDQELTAAGLTPDVLDDLREHPERRAGLTPEQRRLVARKAAAKSAERLARKVRDQVVTGAVVNVGGQTALCVRDFQNPKSNSNGFRLQPEQSTIHRFQEILSHNGYTVGPNQLVEQWLQGGSDAQAMLRKLNVPQPPQVTFPAAPLVRLDDPDHNFAQHETVRAFAGLAADAEAPPYLRVLPKIVNRLVEGLGSEGAFAAVEGQGLGPLAQLSLNRILGFMDQARAAKDDFAAFLNLTQLIMEEVATLLAVAQPHQPDRVAQELGDVTRMLPDDWPGELAPKFSLKNSATRCFASVLTGLEDMKERLTGKRGLNIAVQKDSYYEPSVYVLPNARDHAQHTFDTEAGTVGEDARLGQEGGPKLECYLCEFHHNISYDRKSYKPEQVSAQVRKLFDEGKVAEPFTVVIDTTIATTDAPELKGFLTDFQEEIRSGKLNVVIYRSAQKFDQMGMDNYNGGVMARINNGGEAFAGFNDGFDTDHDAITSQNVQGLTHYNKYAQEELNEYRSAIMANTAKLASPTSTSPVRFPPEMLLKDENAGLTVLGIAVNEDPNAPFIDLKFPGVTPDSPEARLLLGELYDNVIRKRLEEEPDQYPGSTRASFGFPHSNFTLIGDAKLRFNPGLEGDEVLARYRDLFLDVNGVLTEAKNDFEGLGLDQTAVNARMAKCLDNDLIKDVSAVWGKPVDQRQREDHLRVARGWLRAENPVAALRALNEAYQLAPHGLELAGKVLRTVFSREKRPLRDDRELKALQKTAETLLKKMTPPAGV